MVEQASLTRSRSFAISAGITRALLPLHLSVSCLKQLVLDLLHELVSCDNTEWTDRTSLTERALEELDPYLVWYLDMYRRSPCWKLPVLKLRSSVWIEMLPKLIMPHAVGRV